MLNKFIHRFSFFSAIFVFLGTFFGSHTAIAAPQIQCSIPLAVECDVFDSDGFSAVTVAVDFGGEIGVINVVSQSFQNCRNNTVISWDPIVPNYQIITTPCTSGIGKITYDGNGKGSKTPQLSVSSYRIIESDDGRSLKAALDKPDSKPLPSQFTGFKGDDIKQGIFETDCTWTNQDQAKCLVWDCDGDGVCVELGSYCVDKYGRDVPCAD
ncbi:hypothetical protein [Aurantivibrio plasticivorans]